MEQVMSEQAPNSHDAAVANIEKMFGGEEPEAPVVEQPAEGEPQEAEASDQEPVEAQPEEVEVEIDGETYLMPKKISEKFIHQADYTKKTQEVAELRRVLSAQREQSVLEKAFSDATSQERKQIDVLDAQLEQFKNVDWNSLETDQIVRYGRQRESLKEAKQELEKQIDSKRTEFNEKVKELSGQAVASAQKYVQDKIKGFDDNLKNELFAYSLSEGYTRDELDRLVDPRLVVSLWKAQQWDQLQRTKPTVMNKAAQAAPTVKPGGAQKPVSRVQQLEKRFRDSKGTTDKKRAAEDWLTAKFGG